MDSIILFRRFAKPLAGGFRALAVLLLVVAHADAQQITVTGVARSYSANHFLRTICPQFFRVNDAAALKTGEAFLELGTASAGSAAMKAAVIKEIARRRAEVDATGESAWCGYQRASMIADGLGDLFR